MFNFYLSKIGFENANPFEIENCLILLNELVIDDAKPEDIFLKNNSFWEFPTKEGLFGEIVFSKLSDCQFANTVAPKLIENIKSIDEEFTSLAEFDQSIYKIFNSFFGANFDNSEEERHIFNKLKYIEFKKNKLWILDASSFWERRDILFSNIIFCNSVEDDIKIINSTFLSQIIKKLVILDRFVEIFWKEGSFSYVKANENTSLEISPESSKTMQQEKYYKQRIFKMPDGRNECFELHIKSGNLRIHFFPEKYKIYIGYIGKHLDTDKF